MGRLQEQCWIVTVLAVLFCVACGGGSGDGLADGGEIEDIADAGTVPVSEPWSLGPYAVGYTSFIVVDSTRGDRELDVSVWYPVDEADAEAEPRTEYPLHSVFLLPSDVAVDDLPVSSEMPRALLVFSHGYGSINTQSTVLMEVLSSHGFIVASPSHTGNTALDLSDPTPAQNRVPDVSFVIDRMLQRSGSEGDPFHGRVDAERIGVLGHSYGGATAMGMVAGWAGAEADPRVGAIGVIAGSADGGNFDEEALAPVTAPTLFLVGTLDEPALNAHRHAFDNMPSAEALFKVEVKDANHTHFANVCDIGDLLIGLGIEKENWPGIGAEALVQPYDDTCTEDVFPIAEAHRLQNLYMVAHFRRYLLGHEGYDLYLSQAYAHDNEPAIDFQSR